MSNPCRPKPPGELFAECPLPKDGPISLARPSLSSLSRPCCSAAAGPRELPLSLPVGQTDGPAAPHAQAVETVNDSSRYFVLRVFDSVSGRCFAPAFLSLRLITTPSHPAKAPSPLAAA